MTSESKSAAPLVVTLLIAFAVVGICAFVWSASAWYVGTVATRGLHMALFPMLLVVLPILLICGAFAAFGFKRGGGIAVVLVVIAVAIPVGLFKTAYRSDYNVFRDYGSAVTESKTIPDWQMRVNRPQARIDIERKLADTRGKLGDPTYLPDAPGGPAWCAPLTADAPLGRIWTTAIACRSDLTGKVKVGKFPDSTVGAPGGRWSSKLQNQVAEETRGAVFRDTDVYGYLDKDGKPRMVVPITRYGGSFTAVHELPAGVVEFDPDGKATHHEDVAQKGIPGPVVPMVVAENIRKGLNARNGLVAYKRPKSNKNAYQSTSEGDLSDPNSDNPTEFVLRRCDPGSAPEDRPADSTTTDDDCKNPRVVYVTPLTPYGTGRNVTAYLEVEADIVKAGQLPKATLYRLPEPQAATGTIAQTIASLYDADLAWATDNNGGGADNHARLFELTPTGPDALVATIGVGNRSLYRLYIDPTADDDGAFGEICVHVFSTDERIRCDQADAQPVPVGSLRGIAAANPQDPDNPESTPTTVPGTPPQPGVPRPLDTVSTADLIAELNRRAQTGGL